MTPPTRIKIALADTIWALRSEPAINPMLKSIAPVTIPLIPAFISIRLDVYL